MRKSLLILVAVLVLAGIGSAQGSITTTFTSNNGGSQGWVNMFIFGVVNPSGLKITSLDINTSATVLSTINVDIYITPNTYVGKETSLGAWKKVATAQGTAAGQDKPSRVVLAIPLVLQTGNHGFAVHYLNCDCKYTNGSGTGPTGNQRYKNADCGILAGKSVAGLFTGSIFTPRVWNGTIHYEPAVTAVLTGSGAKAKIGTTYAFSLLNAGEPKAIYGVGSSLGSGPIPIDKRSLGLSLDPLLFASTSGNLPGLFVKYSGALDTSGRGTASLVIPNLTALKGVKIYTAFVTANASSPSGISSISNTVDFTIDS